MNQDPVTVIRVDWLRVAPILHLWQAVRIGFRLRVLIPSLLVTAVWSIFFRRAGEVMVNSVTWSLPSLLSLPAPFDRLVILLSSSEDGFAGRQFLALAALSVALTSLLGIAVGRSAATEFCTRTRTGAFTSLRFAFRHNLSGATALVLALVVCAVPFLVWQLSLMLQRMVLDSAVASQLLAAVPILLALALAFTLLVCSVGWFLSLAAIAADGCFASDAMSRGINYVLSHKLYMVCMVAVVLILSNVARQLTYLALVWGLVASGIQTSGAFLAGGIHIVDCEGLFYILSTSVQTGVFLSGMTIAYVLLRHKEDGVQLREIDGAQRTHSA